MNKFFRFITLSLIFCTVLMTISACSKDTSAKLTNNIKSLKFENIKSARIELGRTGGSPIKNYIFDLNSSDHIKVIKDVINHLNSGKIQENEDGKVTNKGQSPTSLILELKDGSVIKIKSSNISNEVTISSNSNEKPVIMSSPEIKNLIDSGYKNIFNE